MNSEIMHYEAMAKELMRRCMAEEEPEAMRQWLTETLARLGGGDLNAVMTWEQSFDLVDKILLDYETLANTPEAQRKQLSWPWENWRKKIDPLEPGILAVVTAPDGMGKTIYGEMIAEHWAKHKNHVVFVHYELNRSLMMLRRTARWTQITTHDIKAGRLSAEQKRKVADIKPLLTSWDGYITYVHTPGWSMERTVSELARLRSEGNCDVVVLDYLEKASASRRQLQMFGGNLFQREADNVEQLKNFAEMSGAPVMMIAQMSKAGKGQSFETMDRTGMRGAGEKSEKSNLVVMLNRERTITGYSNTVNVLIDKNTMGATGTFTQTMEPEFFRVGDAQL